MQVRRSPQGEITVAMHRLLTFSVLLFACGFLAGTLSGDEPKTIRFSVEVDLGQDVGQSFGALFEVRDAQGRVVAGAGFQDVYNTRFRTDRHVLQFFVRPDEGDETFTIERLPHPDLDCGIYLFDLDGNVYAWTSVGENSVRRWDAESEAWVDELPSGVSELRSGDGVMRVGKGLLAFSNDTATYDGRTILSPPEEGGYFNFYYAQGHLCFYHRKTEDDGFTKLYACPWKPSDTEPIDVSHAIVFDTPFDKEVPFAWGQWEDQVLTVSNMGGIYVFEDGQWRMILAPDDQTSYQVYSMLHWHDRLLLAQYPTGNVFEYQGQEAKRLEGWPPVMHGVTSSARECQTLSIYRGDLLAGVWPWAELWRRDRDAVKWQFLDRMFTHPEITKEFQHPYETEARQLNLVTNHWGQRITGMIPNGDSLLLSTSSKGTVEWKDEYVFLTDDKRREYGAVLRLRMPGNLATPIEWQDRPMRFELIVLPGQLSIVQDGEELASATLPEDFSLDPSSFSVTWGAGVFGPPGARNIEGSVQVLDSDN
ncbi:MAG: hypothetical protein KDA93_20835 [Planctomycetaceae bacterium]|nr:hypothetical protein [Planctomycetaceae bacterium]